MPLPAGFRRRYDYPRRPLFEVGIASLGESEPATEIRQRRPSQSKRKRGWLVFFPPVVVYLFMFSEGFVMIYLQPADGPIAEEYKSLE